jgi:hypothetical protein
MPPCCGSGDSSLPVIRRMPPPRREAVAHADQEADVHESPEPPRRRAPQLDDAEIRHRRAPPDRREAAAMPVHEGSGRRIARDARPQPAGDVEAALLRGGREARHGRALPRPD